MIAISLRFLVIERFPFLFPSCNPVLSPNPSSQPIGLEWVPKIAACRPSGYNFDMTKVVEAIYEDGVLTPLEALGLPERQRVEVIVRVKSEGTDLPFASWPQMESSPEARQAALDALFDEIDQADLQLRLQLPTRDELHERR